MAKELHERHDAAIHEEPQPAPEPVAATQEQVDEAATSQEAATARESVRRDARQLDPGQVAALEAAVATPSPSQTLAAEGGGVVGPDLVAEVAAQEQDLKQQALVRAYEAVVVGGAAATGQPAAQQAIADAPPAMREAAQAIATDDSAGAPLPDDVRTSMEARFGEDFSDVQVHVSGDVAALGAGAATRGSHVHFAPGRFEPGTPDGEKLIAHELAHVVQQRQGQGAARVGASDSAAEREADSAGASVQRGEAAPAIGAAPEGAVHLGEAGVHRGIELEAAGVGTEFDPDQLTPEQRAALQLYSGNFIRDFSQVAAPMPLRILSNLPSVHEGGVTGAAGARTLMDALVQSIAIMELGKDIGRSLVTHDNIGVYEAEHHLDNPMGTSAAGDFITEGPEPRAAMSPDPQCIRTIDARGDAVDASFGSTDAATAQTHSGSAVPGLEYENPDLYRVGEGGLSNHLANSTEHAKDRLLDAVRLGPTAEGRMNAGMGLHIVEDYFAHSNFIEVGLNSYIQDALAARWRSGGRRREDEGVARFLDNFGDRRGRVDEDATVGRGVHGEFTYVDTLYDQRDASGRQAITTGTFGGTDTQVSIGHALIAKMPLLEQAMHKGIDSVFGVIDQAAKQKQPPTWEVIKGLLEGKGREGAIAQVMLEASGSVGLAIPCPSGFHVTTREIGLPLIGQISVPSGLELSYTNIAITDALITGAGTYVAVMERLDALKRASGFLFLENVITAAQETIKAAMERMSAAARARFTEMIRQMIIEMAHLDPKKAGHADVEGLAEMAEEQMHEMTERTSLESRMQQGGDLHGLTEQGDNGRAELERRVGPVRARDESAPRATWGTRANPWVTVNPLPPSHSEISKDHPPEHHDPEARPEWTAETAERQQMDAGVEQAWDEHHGHDHNEDEEQHSHEELEGGSGFYELHHQLALEADRHMMYQLEQAWRASLIPGQEIERGQMALDHDAMLAEAGQVAREAAQQSERAGFRHAQTDERVDADLRGRPEVRALLDLVDYFISHPESSTWWRAIFDAYIAAHGDEVHASIRARNRTRSQRQPPG